MKWKISREFLENPRLLKLFLFLYKQFFRSKKILSAEVFARSWWKLKRLYNIDAKWVGQQKHPWNAIKLKKSTKFSKSNSQICLWNENFEFSKNIEITALENQLWDLRYFFRSNFTVDHSSCKQFSTIWFHKFCYALCIRESDLRSTIRSYEIRFHQVFRSSEIFIKLLAHPEIRWHLLAKCGCTLRIWSHVSFDGEFLMHSYCCMSLMDWRNELELQTWKYVKYWKK